MKFLKISNNLASVLVIFMFKMQSLNIVAFVEGTMEKMFINQYLKYVQLISISNGISWTIDALGNDISRKFSVQKRNLDFVIIWVDRGSRIEEALFIADKLTQRMVDCGLKAEQVICIIPDRMTENIFLSDEILMRELLNDPIYAFSDVSCNGKAMIKQIYRNSGVHYKETYHGVLLLKKLRFKNVVDRVVGAKQISERFSNCWWIDS